MSWSLAQAHDNMAVPHPVLEHSRLHHWDLTLQIVSKKLSAMFVVMTIDTKIFPVGPIRGVISVIPILVMNSKKISVLEIKLSATFGTDQAVNSKRLFPIITCFNCPLQFLYNFRDSFISDRLLRLRLSESHLLFLSQ